MSEPMSLLKRDGRTVPRYFKVTENEFEEIAAAEDPLEDKHVFAVIPA